MTNRKPQSSSFFLHEAPDLTEFGTGAAAEILGVPIWRLQKFLDSKQYNLSPTGKLGHGRGSRRVFSMEDLHRIALATWLVRDGFAPQFVGAVVERLDDEEVGVYVDHEGEERSLGVAFYRGEDGPKVKIYQTKNSPELGLKNSPYYRLELDDVFGEIDRRMKKFG
jgi:hypothetical protein